MDTNTFNNRVNILENILHGVLIIDLRGHITYWNRANEMIFGYKKEEILGKSVRMLYSDDQTISFKKILARCVQNDMVSGRWHGKHKDGSRVWLDIRSKILRDNEGEPKSCVITVCDIEKLKSAESLLKKNKALAETILDTSADSIITINERGKILNINRATTKMFGYEEEEITGRNVKILMPLPYSDKHDTYLKNYLETGEKKIIEKGREVQGLKKDGTVFPIDLSVSEVMWEGNRIFAGIIKDLTERRELERRILEIGNEERRKIGRDLHDGLGQMLTGIRMVSENLARKLKANGIPGAEEVQEISDMIMNADEYARVLSQGMVQVDVEKNGLSVALQNLCNRVEKMSGVNCDYTETGNDDVENHMIALHLYRIVQESINNAIKHANPENIKVRLSSIQHHISVVIDDDGRGFDMNEDKYYGSGIQIMKHRAGIMGGVLEIVRTEEKWTRVRCIVPKDLEKF